MKRYWLGTAILAGMIGALGCGGGHSKVEGVVKYEDGAPVDKATVVFMPTDANGKSASGFTDSEGKFSLKTGNVEGAMKGKYKVVITKVKGQGDNPMDPSSKDAMKAMEKFAGKKGGPLVPGKPGMGPGGGAAPQSELSSEYSTPEKTPFTQEVPTSGPVTFTVKKSQKSK